MKLLLVTDDFDLLRALTAALVSHSVEVVHCSDAEDGVNCSWRALPDVVLVDLDLPLARGFTLLGRFQSDAFCCEVPVIATSFHMDHLSRGTAESWGDLGVDTFLLRPFSMLEIAVLLEQTAMGDEVFDDPLATPRPSAEVAQESSVSSSCSAGPTSLGALRNKQRSGWATRSAASLRGRWLAPPHRPEVSAAALRREHAALKDERPRGVLGLVVGAAGDDIRRAARRKRERLHQLRDDPALVPEIRILAQEIGDLIDAAEAHLLGQIR